jgi:hypothetical protein
MASMTQKHKGYGARTLAVEGTLLEEEPDLVARRQEVVVRFLRPVSNDTTEALADRQVPTLQLCVANLIHGGEYGDMVLLDVI